MVETDIANCFSAIPHERLMQAVAGTRLRPVRPEAAARDAARRGDGGRAGPAVGHRNPARRGHFAVAVQRLPAPARPGMGRRAARGAGPLRRRRGRDVQVPAAGRGRAGAAAGPAGRARAWSRRRPRPASCTWQVGGEGFDFLGFHHRLVRCAGDARAKHGHLPGPLALGQGHAARPRPDPGTHRPVAGCCCPSRRSCRNVNRFLRGWAAYFRYGNSARHFDKIRDTRGCGWRCSSANGTNAARAFGRSVVSFQSPNHLGLIGLDGIVARTQALPGLAGDTECRR